MSDSEYKPPPGYPTAQQLQDGTYATQHDCLQCENCFSCCCEPASAPEPLVGSFLVCKQCLYAMRVRTNVDRELWLELIDMSDQSVVTQVVANGEHWQLLAEQFRVGLMHGAFWRSFKQSVWRRFAIVWMKLMQYRMLRRLTFRRDHWELRRFKVGEITSGIGRLTGDGFVEAWCAVTECYAGIDISEERGDVATFKTLACEGAVAPPQRQFVDGQIRKCYSCSESKCSHCTDCGMEPDAHWHQCHCQKGPRLPCDIYHPPPV